MKIKNLLLFSVLSLTLISCTNTSEVKKANTDYTEASNVIYVNSGESNFIADEPTHGNHLTKEYISLIIK